MGIYRQGKKSDNNNQGTWALSLFRVRVLAWLFSVEQGLEHGSDLLPWYLLRS